MINNKKYVDDVGIKAFADKVKEKNTKQDESIDSLEHRSSQMEETIKSIAATGGASQATAVTYNNEKSKLTAVNIQSAVDEVVDKTAIKDEEGTVVETPFSYIQNEEFIFAKVDANNKLLFGIQWDGTPVFGKTSAVEDRLQAQVNLLADKVTTILGDDDTTSAIDTLKELKDFFASIDNTQTLTSILANLNATIDKVAIKDEDGEIQDSPFRIIENEEFIMAIVDSEGKVLFGLYRATGEPYYPLNEMYYVIQNEEYFAAWVTTDDKLVLGIRRDGEIIGEIHAVNALKQVISQLQLDLASLQEKVGTIDINLKELLDVFSLQENPEYLAVEKDADGKILSATNNDGSHYIHNVKSETIPTEFGHIEDPEGRTEITTDVEGKVMSFRDSQGKKHEHDMQVTNLDVSNINLQGNSVNNIGDALKANDFKLDTPSDFSKDSYIELPIPRIAAQVRLYAPKLPTTKNDDIEAEIEYNDKDGNYFRKPVILNAQGASSMNYYVKNMAIDIADGSEIKFGDFPTQDSFHLKKYYIDAFRGQCIVGYWLMEQVYKSRPLGKQYPYEYSYSNESLTNSYGDTKKDFFYGAKCHPDGFPIIITWINTDTNKETWMGVYAWNLKKSKEVYHCDKKKAENIILDGAIDNTTLFGGKIDWTQFEIRNPKSLIDINGDKYDGDNPKELSETDNLSKKVKDYLIRLSGAKEALASANTKEVFEQYFVPDIFIDYWLVSQVLYHFDGFSKNWIWVSYDGKHFMPTLYDADSIFGMFYNGSFIIKDSEINITGEKAVLGLNSLYKTEIEARYSELRKLGVFTADNIINLLVKWINAIGFDNIDREYSVYNETPSYRDGYINDGWICKGNAAWSTSNEYDESKTYSKGEECKYQGYAFEATKTVSGIPPVSKIYTKAPTVAGFYNSPQRVYNWIVKKINSLDILYNYK